MAEGQAAAALLSRTLFSVGLHFRKKPCRILANSNCIVVEPEVTPNLRTIIPLDQVISVRPCYCKKPSKKLTCDCLTESPSSSSRSSAQSADKYAASKLSLVRVYYAVPVGEFRWKITFIPLAVPVSPTNDNDVVLDWISNVSSLLEEFKRPKKLLVFVNPIGGKRRAPKIFSQKVEPLLQLAGITVDTVITERADHARDTIEDAKMSIQNYDGLVCVGGDGMFAELLNGLLIRTQADNNIDAVSNSQTKLLQPSIAVGVIPAGSTDAVAFGVSGTNDPVTSTVHVIFGRRVDIDVSAIHSAAEDQESQRLIRFATSFLGYGYFGDVLLDSERNRWMGPKRYDWAGLKKFLGHRVYTGEVKFRVSTADGSPRDTAICQAECALCAKSALRAKYDLQEYSSNGIGLGSDTETDPSCVTIKGQFLAINAATMSCRCDKAKKGISPAAHLGNGCADLIVVSNCSRFNYLRYLMRTGFLSKSAFELPFVDVYRVREFEFTPAVVETNNNRNESSVWNCDGEVIKDAAVRVKVHCQLLPVFGSGRENRINQMLPMAVVPKRKIGDVNENRTSGWKPNRTTSPDGAENRGMDESHEAINDEPVIKI